MQKYITFILIMFISSPQLVAQSTEKITKELSFKNATGQPVLIVANVNGNITLKGTKTNLVKTEITKTITAREKTLLEKGKSEINIKTIDLGDTLIIYADGPCMNFERNNKHGKGWDYQWNNCNCNSNQNESQHYSFKTDFTMEVPADIHIVLSTINDGNILVENMQGSIHANNINGSIALNNISGKTDVHVINGDINIDYAHIPDKLCNYYSLNGDIHANFPKGLGAQLRFKSFNGNLYSNVPTVETMEAKLDKLNTDDGVRFRLAGNYYRIGQGGTDLDFETFNGNVYIKEK